MAIKGMKMITRDYFPIRLILLCNFCGYIFLGKSIQQQSFYMDIEARKSLSKKVYTPPPNRRAPLQKVKKEIIMKKRA